MLTSPLKVEILTMAKANFHDLCPNEDRSTLVGSLIDYKVTHSGEKLHKCPQCNKLFASASNLKTHMMIHTGRKLYKFEL